MLRGQRLKLRGRDPGRRDYARRASVRWSYGGGTYGIRDAQIARTPLIAKALLHHDGAERTRAAPDSGSAI